MCAISSKLKGQTVERQRYVRIVRVRRAMICAAAYANHKRHRNSQHVPSAFGRVAVQVAVAEFGIRCRALSQLRLRKISTQANLLHGFARGALGVLFLHLESGESLVVQERNGIVERLQELGSLSSRKPRHESFIHLSLESRNIQIGGRDMKFASD